ALAHPRRPQRLRADHPRPLRGAVPPRPGSALRPAWSSLAGASEVPAPGVWERARSHRERRDRSDAEPGPRAPGGCGVGGPPRRAWALPPAPSHPAALRLGRLRHRLRSRALRGGVEGGGTLPWRGALVAQPRQPASHAGGEPPGLTPSAEGRPGWALERPCPVLAPRDARRPNASTAA